MIGKKTIFKNGQMVNGLKYIDDDGYHILPSGVKIRKAIFECECGSRFSVVVKSVVYGRTKSCGCLRIKGIKEGNEKHGFRNDPLYETWNSQKSRCLNPKATGYKYWGGRGIKFSDEFLDIAVWMEYVKSLPNYGNREKENLTLDRIDNNGNYERGNLRWVDRKTQNKNRRKNVC